MMMMMYMVVVRLIVNYRMKIVWIWNLRSLAWKLERNRSVHLFQKNEGAYCIRIHTH